MRKVTVGGFLGVSRCGLAAALACALSLAARADVVTNRWISATGGSWTNVACWSDATYLGTNVATAAFFDFSELASGETVSIPYVADGGVRAYGFAFGTEGGATNDTWLVNREGTYPDSKTTVFYFVRTEDLGNRCEVCIRAGVLRTDGYLNAADANTVVDKTGAGRWRPVGANQRPRFCVVEGGVEAMDQIFSCSTVDLLGADGHLYFFGNDEEYFLGSLRSSTCLASPVDLCGKQVAFGAAGSGEALIDYDILAGDGTVSVCSLADLKVGATQKGFTGTWRIGRGDITFASQKAAVAYRFETVTEPGKAVVGTDLVAVGAPTVVEDPERGNVLSLDGSSHLAAPDATTLPEGLATGSGPYTIAFWMKIAAGCPATATLYYIGKWNVAGGCSLLRLDAGTGGKRGVVYTNFANNRSVANDATEGLYDGAWHHVAVVHTATASQLHIDGVLVDSYTTTPNVQNGEFWIGTGKNNATFKGCIDDFVFLKTAHDTPGSLGESAVLDAFLTEETPGPIASNSIVADNGGVLKLAGPATVAELGGNCPIGAIRLRDELTVQGNGTANEASVFGGALTGTGAFVKKGGDYELTLTGPNAYTGATEVVEGRLRVHGGTRRGCLVGHWTFEDVDAPGRDSSGGGFDLTPSGVSVVEDATRGKVASFGGSAKLSSAVFPEVFPSGNGDYSLSLWLKGTSGCSATAGVAVWGKTGVDGNCALWRLDGTSGWMITNWGNNHNGNAANLRDGAWHHVVWTKGGTTATVYIDGVCADAWNCGTVDVVLDGSTFNLAFNPASSQYFKGYMDDVRFYNYALTESEALAQATAEPLSARLLPEVSLPDPLYRWTFEDDADPGRNTGLEEDGALTVVGNARCAEVEGRGGKVLDLTGSTMSYLTAETFPAKVPTGNADWTVAFWMRPAANQTVNDCAVYWGNPAKDFVLVGNVNGSPYFFNFRATYRGGGDVYKRGFEMPYAGASEVKWHHVAVVKSGTTVTLCIDGKVAASKGGLTLNVGNAHFWIGRKASSETDWWRGYLDDMCVFDVALGVEQVRRVMGVKAVGAGALPETTPVTVAAEAEFVIEGARQRIASLAGEGVVDVMAGSVLEVVQGGTFNGQLKLASRDGLEVGERATLKVTSCRINGAKVPSGLYGYGSGTLQVGVSGSMVIVR